MPAQRPSASFEPISPDLDLASLVEETPNFEYVVRISYDMIEHQGLEAFEKLVLLHVIVGGKPLIIEGLHHRLDEWIFTSQWLHDNHGQKFEQARNISKQRDMPISISHYLSNLGKLTNQWNHYNYKDTNRQRIYLKDIDCPEVWHDKLKEQIPPGVFYLNDSTGEIGGPGSVNGPNSSGPGSRYGRGVARAGDLMSCLPPAMRAENLMCYIGHEGTYTPAHREMCASLGQNIMVEASGTVDENGKPCKPGSSIWFMTETKERHLVSEYWLSTLGHDIEVESHFAQINAWKAAPFKTYVIEQKVGDFILIPPLAPHQVWNRGTRTMKVAWNRTTVETLEMALNEALPRARMVCRDEQYKNKAIVMFALERYSNLLKVVDIQKQTTVDPQGKLDLTLSPKIRQLEKDFRRLFSLFGDILLSEMLPPVAATENLGQYLPYDSYVTCSYCRCNIFNRFLTCPSCIIPLEDGEEDTYDVCMECYVMGRSCKCISGYKWVEQFPWQELIQKHEHWRLQVIGFDGNRVTEKSPQSLQVQRKNLTKKTLAQVCHEQLKVRPWCDPKKEKEISLEKELLLEEGLPTNDGTPRKRRTRKRQSEKFLRENARCHISKNVEPRWKVAGCKCGRGYHYGTLFRAFDVMPLTAMEDPNWSCPYCLNICSCAQCRKLPSMRPFEPNGTILGHDTRKIADPRSVESLVDFSHSNISWIEKAGDNDLYETRRLRRRKDEAALDKSTDAALDDHYVNEEECTPVTSQYTDNGIQYMDTDLPIDPMLRMEHVPTSQGESMNGDVDESGQTNPQPELATKLLGYQNSHLKDSNATSDSGRPNRLAAPAAVMVDREHRTNTAQENNGIFYQYPDPTLSQFAPPPRRSHFHPPPKNAQYNGLQDNVRRKRQEAQDIIQSNPISKNDANEQYHHAQTQSTLAEATRNDRFISAEAAITGKRLQLVLPIDRTKFAAFAAKDLNAPQPRPSLEGDIVENDNVVILQSDVPSVPLTDPPQSNGSKKRKSRADNDEDFPTRSKSGRKSMTTRMDLASDVRKPSFSYAELSSDSDDSVPVAGRRTFADKLRMPRKLPAYLSRRNNVNKDARDSSTGSPAEGSHQAPYKDPPQPKKRKVKSSKTQVEEAPAPPSNPLAPTDKFVVEPPPESNSSMDLSMPGIGGTSVRTDPAAKQAEENRKAKLKALKWAETETNVSDSSAGITSHSKFWSSQED